MYDNALESGFYQDREERLIRERIIKEEKHMKRHLLHNEIERIKQWFRTKPYR